MIPNIELLPHVSYVNLQGKSNNLHWNHSIQRDVHDPIFNKDVIKKKYEHYSHFDTSKLVEHQEWVKRFQMYFP
jgi:hypothetical protein